jgi:hypothetical protein
MAHPHSVGETEHGKPFELEPYPAAGSKRRFRFSRDEYFLLAFPLLPPFFMSRPKRFAYIDEKTAYFQRFYDTLKARNFM